MHARALAFLEHRRRAVRARRDDRGRRERHLKGVTIRVAGASSAAVATDRDGGTIVARGGSYRTTGGKRPVLYSTGVTKLTGGTGTATDSEAAVIEGANYATVVGSALKSGREWCVMLYQSISGDAASGSASYTMSGGSLSVAAGPAFRVTNTTGTITLQRAAKNVGGDSTLTSPDGAMVSGPSITNISGGGHTVTYDASRPASKALGAKTYALAGGGTLEPA